MRDLDSNLQAALEAANTKGLVPRRLVRLTGKSFDTGAATEGLFWTGHGAQSFFVESPFDETNLTRTYNGNVGLQTSSIALVTDLTIQTLTVTLNHRHPLVAAFIRGSDLRLGKVEVHDVLLSTTSRNPVSVAPLLFYGEIDGSPISLGAKDSAGDVSIRCNSDVISMLSRTNPAKSSYQEQKQRDGDEWGLYGNTLDTWKVSWGTKD